MLSAFLLSITATLQLQNVIFTQAFITEQHIHRSSHTSVASMTPLRARRNDDFFPSNDDGDNDRFDLEALRQQFESLASNTGAAVFSSAMQDDSDLGEKEPVSSGGLLLIATDSVPLRETPPLDVPIPPRPPLTSIERERRSAEIELLGHLTDGEEAVKEIYNLWFSERGAAASKLLQQARELMEQGREEQDEAESMLRALVDEYGVYFTGKHNKQDTWAIHETLN